MNKHIAKQTIRAGMEVFPTGAGFMGQNVDYDARDVDETKARKTGTELGKPKENELKEKYSAEGLKKRIEAIKKNGNQDNVDQSLVPPGGLSPDVQEIRAKEVKSAQKEKAKKNKAVYFGDVNMKRDKFSWEQNKTKSEAKPSNETRSETTARDKSNSITGTAAKEPSEAEKKPGVLNRGLKYTIDQLNPVKAFKEIREKWRETGAQFNEELLEENQVEKFFADIPEAEREKYGYSELLHRARSIDHARGELFKEKNKKRDRFAGIFSALGIKRDVVEDEDVRRLEANSSDQHKILLEMGMKAFADDPQKTEKFMNQFHQTDFSYRERKLEQYFRAVHGKLGDRVVYGLDRIGRTFKEQGMLRKMAITTIGTTGVVIGGTMVGFGTLGTSTMMLASRFGISALGGLSLGIGKKLKYEGKRMAREDAEKSKNIKDVMEAMERGLNEGIQKMHESIPSDVFRRSTEENIFKDNRKAALWGGISGVFGRIAGEYMAHEGITFSSLMKKVSEHTGLNWENIRHSFENFAGHQPHDLTALQDAAAGLKHGGVAATLESQAGTHFDFSHPGGGVSHSTEFTGGSRVSDAGPHIAEQAQADRAGGIFNQGSVAEANGPQAPGPFGGEISHGTGHPPSTEITGSGQPHGAEMSAESGQAHAPEVSADVQAGHSTTHFDSEHVPVDTSGLRILGSHKVVSGGLEESAQDIIEKNPKAFGLDPDNPRFHSQVGRKAHELADNFRDRLGLKKDLFNEIASHRVQPGDTVEIYQNPSTGKAEMLYHGKAFGNRVLPSISDVHAGTSAQDLATEHPPVSEPRSARVYEHHSSGRAAAEHHHRPTGARARVQTMQEIDANYKQDLAQRHSARVIHGNQELHDKNLVKAAENARDYAIAHTAQVRETGTGIKRLFEGAGVSDYVDVLKKPMSEWNNLVRSENFISQDVQDLPAIDKLNFSTEKLRNLYPILQKYNTSGHDSIDECLFKAMKDSKNVYMINKLVLNK